MLPEILTLPKTIEGIDLKIIASGLVSYRNDYKDSYSVYDEKSKIGSYTTGHCFECFEGFNICDLTVKAIIKMTKRREDNLRYRNLPNYMKYPKII